MEIHQLRYFVACAEAGSMTLAARRSHVSQPSLSQQVKKLEDGLGVLLFDRLGKGIVLTDAGRALLPRARRILSELDDTQENLRARVESGAGVLSIGAIPTIAPYLLPPVLARLRREFPECVLRVREDLTARMVDAVASGELDVAITSTPIDRDRIDVEVVGSEPLLVVTPSKHPLAGLSNITHGDLREQATITLDEMHCLGQQVGAFCAKTRLRPDVVCKTTQLSTVLELVRLGLGVSLIPAMAAARDDARSRVYVPFARQHPSREIALIWRTGRTRPRLARSLNQMVRDALEEALTARLG